GPSSPHTQSRPPARVRQPPRPAIVRSALRASPSMKDLGLSGIIPVPAGCLPAWLRPAPGSSAVIVSILGDSRVIFTIRNTFYKVSVDDSPPLVPGERPVGRGQALAGTRTGGLPSKCG